MARQPRPQTTIKLLPDGTQRAALDDTWARAGRLMNIAQTAMIRAGDTSRDAACPVIVELLRESPDSVGLSKQMLQSIWRTAARPLNAHTESLAEFRFDWTDPSAFVEISVTGRMVAILRGGEASIQTVAGRISMPCELLEGEPQALQELDWHFYWMRDEAGEHGIQYRPGEVKTRAAMRCVPAAQDRYAHACADIRRRKVLKQIGIEVDYRPAASAA